MNRSRFECAGTVQDRDSDVTTLAENSQVRQRDLRIDLIRGVALLVLVTDHLPGNPLRQWMPVSWGLADMAEVFVLLSGYVYGLGLQRPISLHERRRKLFWRAVTIYTAYVVASLLAITLVRIFRISSIAEMMPPHLLANSWMDLFLSVVTFQGRVSQLCILLLYFWFTCGLAMIPLQRGTFQFRGDVPIVSVVVYLASQVSPLASLPEPLAATTFYNPFAWQLLFVTGATFAVLSDASRKKIFGSRYLLAGACVVQGLLLLARGLNLEIPPFLVDKSQFGILRYLHIVTAAYIVSEILPRDFSASSQRLMRPMLQASEQSLWVYCGGVLIVVSVSDWVAHTDQLLQILAANLLAWSGCLLIGWLTAKLTTTRLWRTEAR